MTLNNEGSESSADYLELDSAGLIDTQNIGTPKAPDDTPSEGVPPEKEEGAEAKADDAANDDAKESSKETPFHEHPDWIAFKDRNTKDLRAAQRRAEDAERKLEELSVNFEKKLTDLERKSSPLPYDYDVSELSAEELQEKWDEDPKAVLNNYGAKMRHEIEQSFNERSAQDPEGETPPLVDKALEAYADEHEDLYDMWEAGDIQSYIEDNPGHSVISAHQMLSMEKRMQEMETQHKEDIEKAVAEKAAELEKQFKSKTKASTSLTSTPVSHGAGDEIDPVLADPKKYGLTPEEAQLKSLNKWREGRA